ncbi:hypothetical protein D3C74_339600 [compost metagenome]
MIWLGAMPVSFDLLIFSPPTRSQPCANTVLGRGRPAAMSIAGQITAWKRRMSLPTRCTLAGHVAANLACCSGSSLSSPTAVA